jgi:xylulokinase
VLERELMRLESSEGPALGAAVTALAALETHRRCEQGIEEPYSVADAVGVLVRFRKSVQPNTAWGEHYRERLAKFKQRIKA